MLLPAGWDYSRLIHSKHMNVNDPLFQIEHLKKHTIDPALPGRYSNEFTKLQYLILARGKGCSDQRDKVRVGFDKLLSIKSINNRYRSYR
jgi:hypothetical protein